eukprot:1141077-Pyramimonas_sp.AAC.1
MRAWPRKVPPISRRSHAASSSGRPSRHCRYLALKSCALGAVIAGAAVWAGRATVGTWARHPGPHSRSSLPYRGVPRWCIARATLSP